MDSPKTCGNCANWKYKGNFIYTRRGGNMPWCVEVPHGTEGSDVHRTGECVAPLPDSVLEVDSTQISWHDATNCPCWKTKE